MEINIVQLRLLRVFLLRFIQKHHLPTHCILPDGLGLKYKSMVMCEQIRVIDKSRLFKKIATLNKRQMAIIDKKIKISLDLRLHNPKK